MATPPLPTVRFPWRAAIYGIAILYIGADLYLFHGPLSKMVDRMYGQGIEEQIAEVPTGLIATVNTWPITVADLDRGVWEYCTVRGMEIEKIDPKRIEVIRAVVLGDLINDLAVWHYARLNPEPVGDEEVEAALAQVRGHFANEEVFIERLAAQGMNAASFREHIADQIHQRKWLEAKAAPYVSVSDEEIRACFERDEALRRIPERWRARHIFMATLDKDPAAVGREIAKVASDLTQGTITFEEAAQAFSEDERTKKRGGDLGYFSRQRMPEDFITGMAKQQPGTAGAPFQTKLGWHIVEVSDHQAEREASIEEMHDEIAAHLESLKRKNVIAQIVRDTRKRSKIWPPEPKPRAIIEP